MYDEVGGIGNQGGFNGKKKLVLSAGWKRVLEEHGRKLGDEINFDQP